MDLQHTPSDPASWASAFAFCDSSSSKLHKEPWNCMAESYLLWGWLSWPLPALGGGKEPRALKIMRGWRKGEQEPLAASSCNSMLMCFCRARGKWRWDAWDGRGDQGCNYRGLKCTGLLLYFNRKLQSRWEAKSEKGNNKAEKTQTHLWSMSVHILWWFWHCGTHWRTRSTPPHWRRYN